MNEKYSKYAREWYFDLDSYTCTNCCEYFINRECQVVQLNDCDHHRIEIREELDRNNGNLE